jgi:hypothetical protein
MKYKCKEREREREKVTLPLPKVYQQQLHVQNKTPKLEPKMMKEFLRKLT